MARWAGLNGIGSRGAHPGVDSRTELGVGVLVPLFGSPVAADRREGAGVRLLFHRNRGAEAGTGYRAAGFVSIRCAGERAQPYPVQGTGLGLSHGDRQLELFA